MGWTGLARLRVSLRGRGLWGRGRRSGLALVLGRVLERRSGPVRVLGLGLGLGR